MADAARLQGRPVVVGFHADAPAFTAGGVTIAGPGPTPAGIKRVVYLPGDLDVKRGERLRVSGVLRVVIRPKRLRLATEIRIADAELAP
jgi:hypothetical protein